MKKDMTFETASAELEEILAELSAEDTPLDRSVELYADAAKLIAYCNKVLKEAQIKIQEIDETTAQVVSE